MFALRKPEKPAVGIIRVNDPGKAVPYDKMQLSGKWWRVFPVDSREVSALRMLDMHTDKFAPAVGNGLLVSDAAIRRYELSPAINFPTVE
jgi:hypothetical protein